MTDTSLSSRLLVGALAGLSATMAMTAVMRRLYRLVPTSGRYPLPPREITERIVPAGTEAGLRNASLTSHLGYGVAVGTLVGAADMRPSVAKGALFGVGIWAASYFGWIPAARILKPPTRHPAARNALMITAHLVWGAAISLGIRELSAARDNILAGGALRDAPPLEGEIR